MRSGETSGIKAAGIIIIKKTFSLWMSWQCTAWWNFRQKNIEIYPTKKEIQREVKQKSFFNFIFIIIIIIIMVVQNSMQDSYIHTYIHTYIN